MRVLTTGATGQFAGLVTPTLSRSGVQVRALVHDPAKAEQLMGTGVSETVTGDLRDSASMRAALEGMDGLFLTSPEVALGATPDGPMRDGLTAMFVSYTAHGFHGGNSLVLSSILGRPPRTLEAFVAELALGLDTDNN